jgi:polyisoprenoid-binding protein YceI
VARIVIIILGMEIKRRAVESETEHWEIDLARSSLTFNLRHIVVQQIQGQFERWGGTLFVNRRQPDLSSVRIWVDLTSIATGDAERDGHVRSPEFFDVARFSRAVFRSTQVRVGDGEILVKGKLDLHGIVRDVEMRAIAGAVEPSTDGHERSAYNARGTINRQAFGLHWNQDLDIGGVVVGDQVEIFGHAELVRADGAASKDLPRAGQRG